MLHFMTALLFNGDVQRSEGDRLSYIFLKLGPFLCQKATPYGGHKSSSLPSPDQSSQGWPLVTQVFRYLVTFMEFIPSRSHTLYSLLDDLCPVLSLGYPFLQLGLMPQDGGPPAWLSISLIGCICVGPPWFWWSKWDIYVSMEPHKSL
jgi:hypothetical protein